MCIRDSNTSIGNGWACPHARTKSDGELLCAIGWSPKGIEYGASDGAPVHLVVMYYVPDSQKNAYLKEISSLAKAVLTVSSMYQLSSFGDLGEVRHRLLDAISTALESMGPDARARMIQLEVKHASVSGVGGAGLPSNFAAMVVPMEIVVVQGISPVVLGQDLELVQLVEAQPELIKGLREEGRVNGGKVLVMVRSVVRYQQDRVVYECLAMRK